MLTSTFKARTAAKKIAQAVNGAGLRTNNAIYEQIFGMAESAEAMRVAGSIFGSMQHVAGSVQQVGIHEQAISSYVFPSGVGCRYVGHDDVRCRYVGHDDVRCRYVGHDDVRCRYVGHDDVRCRYVGHDDVRCRYVRPHDVGFRYVGGGDVGGWVSPPRGPPPGFG